MVSGRGSFRDEVPGLRVHYDLSSALPSSVTELSYFSSSLTGRIHVRGSVGTKTRHDTQSFPFQLSMHENQHRGRLIDTAKTRSVRCRDRVVSTKYVAGHEPFLPNRFERGDCNCLSPSGERQLCTRSPYHYVILRVVIIIARTSMSRSEEDGGHIGRRWRCAADRKHFMYVKVLLLV